MGRETAKFELVYGENGPMFQDPRTGQVLAAAGEHGEEAQPRAGFGPIEDYNEYGLPNDGYDYSQHLKPMGVDPGAVYIAAAKDPKAVRPGDAADLDLLPAEILAGLSAKEVEKVRDFIYRYDDEDPELTAELFGNDPLAINPFSGEAVGGAVRAEEEGAVVLGDSSFPDDFVALASRGGKRASQSGKFSSSRFARGGQLTPWQAQILLRKLGILAPQEDTVLFETAEERQAKKEKTVVQEVIEEHFEGVLASYDDELIGELESEESEDDDRGIIYNDDDYLNDMLEEFEATKNRKKVDAAVALVPSTGRGLAEEDLKVIARMRAVEAGEVDNVDEEGIQFTSVIQRKLHTMELKRIATLKDAIDASKDAHRFYQEIASRDNPDAWVDGTTLPTDLDESVKVILKSTGYESAPRPEFDAQTILSTHTSLYNHPSTIGKPTGDKSVSRHRGGRRGRFGGGSSVASSVTGLRAGSGPIALNSPTSLLPESNPNIPAGMTMAGSMDVREARAHAAQEQAAGLVKLKEVQPQQKIVLNKRGAVMSTGLAGLSGADFGFSSITPAVPNAAGSPNQQQAPVAEASDAEEEEEEYEYVDDDEDVKIAGDKRNKKETKAEKKARKAAIKEERAARRARKKYIRSALHSAEVKASRNINPLDGRHVKQL